MLFFDPPGFNDTNKNRRLANSLALEKIIYQLGQVKLTIVIDYLDFSSGRSESVKALFILLGEILTPDNLNNPEKHINTLFMFIDKAGRVLEPESLRDTIEELKSTLISEQESANSIDELESLERGIGICESIIRTPDTHLIFVNPMDDGTSRSLIYQSVKSMHTIDSKSLNFNTKVRRKFREELITNFITPHLRLLYRESIHHELSAYSDAS